MKQLAVLGGGSWGTALAVILAQRFARVRLWVRKPELASQLEATRRNPHYLPGVELPRNIQVTADFEEAVRLADIILCAVPSRAVRATFGLGEIDPATPVVSATKGLEAVTLLRMSQVIAAASGARHVAVLSGPSFAWEAVQGQPTAVVVAADTLDLARKVQMAFSGGSFRVYSSDDPAGVELGGAYKNVVAIGAGVCQGLGFGHNTISALITRGLAEMTRLAIKIGCRPLTLSGLSGLGDLVLTCTGNLSRNRRVGEELASGKPLEQILAGLGMVAEGAETARSIVELGRLHHVELPIAEQMDAVIHARRPPREAIQRLMVRALTNEL